MPHTRVLVATSEWSHRRSSLGATVFLARGLRATLLRRRGLLFDSRFAYAGAGPQGVATAYLVREGTFEPSSGPAVRGTSAWLLREGELERRVPDAARFRTWGEPLVAMTLVVGECEMIGPVGIEAGPRALSAGTWAAFDALDAAAHDAEREERMHDLLAALAADRVITEDLVAAIRAFVEPASVRRIWCAVAQRYVQQDTGVYTDLLASIAGTSARQAARDTHELVQRLPLFGGFRSTVRTLRLRRAVLLLSAPDLRVSDVATVVGYGSAAAMSRAFRDAGLPSPSEVREQVRLDGAEA